MKTKCLRRIEKINALKGWLLNTFAHPRHECQRDRLNIVGQLFTSGCYLIAAGEKEAGMFFCSRAIRDLNLFVDRVQTKSDEVLRFVPTNCMRFAHATASRAEINKLFRALGYKDEPID